VIRHERGSNDLVILPLSARRCALFTSMTLMGGSLKVAGVPSNLLLYTMRLTVDGLPRLLTAPVDTAVVGSACPAVL